MPGLVGGFGNTINFFNNFFNEYINIYFFNKYFNILRQAFICNIFKFNWKYNTKIVPRFNYYNNKTNLNAAQLGFAERVSNLGPYLAGLIEGDGTFAIKNNNNASGFKNYNPKIIIVFKKSDLPLAEFLNQITKCGKVSIKSDRGYVLWEIQDIFGVYYIAKLINGYMRTPKIEALHRLIDWLNEYIYKNKSYQEAAFPIRKPTLNILKKISYLEKLELDNSPIESNSWFAGFSDADSNFSINIHKRSNKNSIRVQLYYRLEIRQNYHKLNSDKLKSNYFTIISKIGLYLKTNVLSRSRIIKDKEFFSYNVIAHNKYSKENIIIYFNKYPLLSSKFLDFKDWYYIYNLQNVNSITTSYLNEAQLIRNNFNKTRTTYNWDHLKNCYLLKN